VYNVDATKLGRYRYSAIQTVNVHANRVSTDNFAIDANRDFMNSAQMAASKSMNCTVPVCIISEIVCATKLDHLTINRNAVHRLAIVHAN